MSTASTEKSPEKSPENSCDVVEMLLPAVEMLLPGPMEVPRAASVSERQCGAGWLGIRCVCPQLRFSRVCVPKASQIFLSEADEVMSDHVKLSRDFMFVCLFFPLRPVAFFAFAKSVIDLSMSLSDVLRDSTRMPYEDAESA
jgi:hypothetical protein